MNRELLKDLLEAGGHEVIEADDGPQSLEAARQHAPDVILLDVMMPPPNGFEVCQTLKGEEATAHIPILLVTALADRNARIQGIQAGADNFLTKPIDTGDVVLRVRNALRLKRLHDLAQERFRALQELEQMKEQLVHMLVHDFKSPLSSTLGYLKLMRTEPLSEQQQEYLSRALRGGERLTRMITAMLDVYRMESHSLELRLEGVQAIALLRATVESLRSLAEPGVDFGIECPEDLCLGCDPDLIQRVLENLGDNAVRYLPLEGGRVELKARPEGESLYFEVVDNGGGICDENISKIFGRFHTAERNRSSQGLGLSFCKMAVELHGGTIGVTSEEEKGSTFWFELPIRAEAAR